MSDLYDSLMEMAGAIPDIKPWRPTTMPPKQEKQFQKDIMATPWYKEFVAKYGEAPNFDDPNYNYREAWRQGVLPTERNPQDKMFHWPDMAPSGAMLKSPYHPAAWAEYFIKQYGINPDDLPPTDPRVTAFSNLWYKHYPPRY